MNFLSQYGLFLVETVTIVVAIVVIITTIFTFAAKDKSKEKLIVKKINVYEYINKFTNDRGRSY